jgi:hypothetical protein
MEKYFLNAMFATILSAQWSALVEINWILITLCNYLHHMWVTSWVCVRRNKNWEILKNLINHELCIELLCKCKIREKFCYFFHSLLFVSIFHFSAIIQHSSNHISFPSNFSIIFLDDCTAFRSDYGRNQVKKPAGHFDKWIITRQRHSLACCVAIFRFVAWKIIIIETFEWQRHGFV